jgi:membrane-associated phospholipid phosphatase
MKRSKSGKRICVWVLAAALSSGLFTGIAPNLLQAQTAVPETESHHFNGKYVVKMGIDFGKVLISPIHWKGKDLVLFGASAAAVGLFFGLDHGIQQWVEKHDVIKSTTFSLVVTRMAEGPFMLSLMATMYLGGEAFKNDGLRKTALMSLESYAIAGVIVGGLKIIFGRHRPLAGHGPFDFNFFSLKNHEHAFPGGHSIAAFSVASVIAGQSDSVFIGVLSYGLASLIALSRVNNNEHWASDVICGSIMGYFIGKEVLALNRPSTPGKPTLSFAPGPGGFSLSLRF